MTTFSGDLRHLVTPAWSEYGVDDAVYIMCQFHNDTSRPSMRVFENGAHCFTCGKHLHRDEFLTLYDEKTKTSAKLLMQTRSQVEKAQRTPTDPAVLAKSAHAMLLADRSTQRFLNDRGLTQDTIATYLLGHYGPAYTLPVFGEHDEVLNVRFRRDDAISTEGHKFWGLKGQNGELLYPYHRAVEGKKVILTEGEMDALLLRQDGLPAYSFTNGAQACPKDDVLRLLFATVQTVLLVRDQDAPGRAGTLALKKRLLAVFPKLKVLCYEWNLAWGKDVTDLWLYTPLEYGKLLSTLEHPKPFPNGGNGQ